MKRLAIALLLLLCVSSESSAQVGILAFPEEATPVGSDKLYLVKGAGGAGTDRYTSATNLTKSLAAASASAQGVVTAGAQTFAGAKTFTSNVVVGPSALTNPAGWTNIIQVTSVNFPSVSLAKTSATAQQWDIANNAGTFLIYDATVPATRFSIAPVTGRVSIGPDQTPDAQLDVEVLDATTIGLMITLAATPTANAFEVNSSAGTGGDLAKITAAGAVGIGGGTPILKVLSATGTLDFGSTAAGAVSDLTITVTGAAVGDIVALGVPNGSMTTTGTFFGWVSAVDTVTVRYIPNSLVGSSDPASGTFRVQVTKF